LNLDFDPYLGVKVSRIQLRGQEETPSIYAILGERSPEKPG